MNDDAAEELGKYLPAPLTSCNVLKIVNTPGASDGSLALATIKLLFYDHNQLGT